MLFFFNFLLIWESPPKKILISEGSCDTEDWSNDAENSALKIEINYIFKYIQIKKTYFKLQ